MLSLAKIADRHRVEDFVIGSELLSLEHERRHWLRLVAKVRRVFSGRVLYSANWDQLDGPAFWDGLDAVGVNAYFEIDVSRSSKRVEAVTQSWLEFLRSGHQKAQLLKKPLVLTEVGYPSLDSAAARPWDETRDGGIDLALQADLYEGFCRALEKTDVDVHYFFFWNWFGWGGPEDGSYSPRGKPAARVMKSCLQRHPIPRVPQKSDDVHLPATHSPPERGKGHGPAL